MQFFRDLGNAPERQYTTEAAAPTQVSAVALVGHPPKRALVNTTSWLSEVETPAEKQTVKPAKKEFNALDAVVKSAGSRWALGFTLLLLLAWALWGAIAGPTHTWQGILQDVSSIQAYFSATLLLRQQQTSCRDILGRICRLISRSESNERMLKQLSPQARAQMRRARNQNLRKRSEVQASLQTTEGVLDKVANSVAGFVGSLYFLAFYWTGILAWAVCGVPLAFSDTWQLYVNTATALEITLTTVFLQNIRRQHDEHLHRCIQEIDTVDAATEARLRHLTGDTTPNPVVASTRPTLTRAQNAIDIYAYILGGAIGLTISASVFALWIAIGHQLAFADNWWLIIGTYTGLVGFIDGFIMKNVDSRETALATQHFARLLARDAAVFAQLDAAMPPTPASDDAQDGRRQPLILRMSRAVDGALPATVSSYAAVGIVAALLVVASALRWTETGQLLCNTPTMIVEGFLLAVLLQAHNLADARRRRAYDDILQRRVVLAGFLDASSNDGDDGSDTDTDTTANTVSLDVKADTVARHVSSHVV